jgi:hypothetical protein
MIQPVTFLTVGGWEAGAGTLAWAQRGEVGEVAADAEVTAACAPSADGSAADRAGPWRTFGPDAIGYRRFRRRASLDDTGEAERLSEEERARLTVRWLTAARGCACQWHRPTRACLMALGRCRGAVKYTHLDHLACGQHNDGGWTFGWMPWSAAAEQIWRGSAAVDALRALRANGRLQRSAGLLVMTVGVHTVTVVPVGVVRVTVVIPVWVPVAGVTCRTYRLRVGRVRRGCICHGRREHHHPAGAHCRGSESECPLE